MFRRYTMVAISGLLVTGFALAVGGCSDSPPAPPASTTPQPAAPAKPEPTTSAKGKKDPLLDMGVKEKREWRKQQKAAAAAGGQTP